MKLLLNEFREQKTMLKNSRIIFKSIFGESREHSLTDGHANTDQQTPEEPSLCKNIAEASRFRVLQRFLLRPFDLVQFLVGLSGA